MDLILSALNYIYSLNLFYTTANFYELYRTPPSIRIKLFLIKYCNITTIKYVVLILQYKPYHIQIQNYDSIIKVYISVTYHKYY